MVTIVFTSAALLAVFENESSLYPAHFADALQHELSFVTASYAVLVTFATIGFVCLAAPSVRLSHSIALRVAASRSIVPSLPLFTQLR
jgi:hypothetical protein